MEAAAKQEPPAEEQLETMSFGDHLEELRKRLLLSVIALAVCILGLLPFKETVTAIYVKPYHDMWMTGFVEYADLVDQKVAEAEAGGELSTLQQMNLKLWRDKQAWLHDYRASIEDGSFPFTDHSDQIKNVGGYQVSYHLVATKPIEDFWTFMAASLLLSLLIAGPFVLYQIWAFVAAGLYKTERRAVLRYVPGAAFLLMLGVSFGYTVVVPYGLYFLVKLMNFGQVQPMVSVSNYFSLLFMLTAALGLVFQLPLVMLTLQKVGVVSHEAMVKNWRYVILLIFVMAAVFTPPDPFTQVMMGVPMVLLYLLGLLLTGRSARRQRLRTAGTT